MSVRLTALAEQDLAYWRVTNPYLAHRIDTALQQLVSGTSLPCGYVTSLALQYAHLLSVKITPEHRLVFERRGNDLIVHQCRHHY